MAFEPTLTPRDPDGTAIDPAHAADLLEASAAAMAAELRALGDDATWSPAPGEWTATEVAGHVIEADRRGFGGRIRRILEAEGGTEAGWDQVAVAAERGDATKTGAALAAELEATRAPNVELLRGLTAADLERWANHPAVGRITIGDVVAEWVFHDRNHLRQMLANGQARVWPVMGNARRFTDPNA